MLVYQIIDGSVDVSLSYQEKNIEKVINGLGRDRTLGAKVAWSDASDEVTQSYYREPSGLAFSVASVDVAVQPFANTGAVS